MKVRALSFSDVDIALWDKLSDDNDPFSEHGFLHALLTSNSVGPQRDSGWDPHFLARENAEAEVDAVCPVYEKSHSYGEYTFDFEWARFAASRGIPYYPKLVAMTPFTPATGPRVLAHEPLEKVVQSFADALRTHATRNQISGAHIMYLSQAEQQAWLSTGFFARANIQFHWSNRGYVTFDDFLSALRSENRKQIKRERKGAQEAFVIRRKLGHELTQRDWAFIAEAYESGCLVHGSEPYLTPLFWQQIQPWASREDARRVMCVLAYQDEDPVAMSINFCKGTSLFGRYWGTTVDAPFLHFECCYYQLIEFAIAGGYQRVEAGAQGIHKLKRGFLPEEIRSAHWMLDPTLDKVARQYSEREAALMRAQIAELAEHSPYRDSSE